MLNKFRILIQKIAFRNLTSSTMVLALFLPFQFGNHHLTSTTYSLYGNPSHYSLPTAQQIYDQGEYLGDATFDGHSLDLTDAQVQALYCPVPQSPICTAVLRIEDNSSYYLYSSAYILTVWYGTY
jgi:hypothetical protein